FSELCFAASYGPLVTNRIFVPRQAVAPQRAMPVEHPALRKTILRGEDEEASAFSISPAITGYLQTFKKEEVSMYLARVSTDYQGENSLITRNSYAIRYGAGGCANSTWRCANNVVDWVIAEASRLMADYPNDWQIEELPFNDDMCSNIRLTIPGELYPDQIVAIGAHLDSRNTGSGRTATGPAPGADDNGSGTAVNLEIVRSIAANERKYKFAYTVHILWFCGEEQGLVGSNAMAQQYKKDGAEIIAYFNNDMIGYTDPRFGVRLSFMTRFSTLWLTNVCKETAAAYVPDLPSGDTTACCSDQQSFFQAGFPAAGIFETPTSGVSYPQYHRTGDTYNSGLINYEQVYLFGKANFACILEFAAPLEHLD
ncbi:MAG: hypothetical protein C0522_15130, partial [Rhodocyclaceae bacterium]|nr:hypothetical protein [Rhodocyclaceae bacterium]